MSAIQFGGLSSGLDTTAMIDALMGAEKLGLTRLQNTHAGYGTTKTAYDRLSTALRDLNAKAKAFTVSSAGSGRSASSSDPTAFSATASIGATTGQYRISVDRLATTTKATSTASIGGAINDASAAGYMSLLPLAGTVTPGDVAIVVDGSIVHATIGAPTGTTLNQALSAIAAAVQAQVTEPGSVQADPGATVTASIVNNKIQLTMTGGSKVHSLQFGAGGQTSNALSIFGLAGVSTTTFATGTPAVASGSLGVTRSTVALNAAGLTGLTSTTTGLLKINGTTIAYDTTVDSLGTILSRINASNAGVTATIDRANDKIVLSNRVAGSNAIDIADVAPTVGVTGTLAAALNLVPGTTAAQTIGQTAQVTVDGQTYISDTNHVTNAISGVAIDLVDETAGARTLTVDVDRTKITGAVTDFVASFNALADLLDAQTAMPVVKGAASGPLAGESALRGLTLSLRSLVTGIAAGLTGSIRSLADIGVTTGAIGSATGSTSRLSLDADKLNKALNNDPSRVADLLGSSGGGVFAPLVTRLTSMTDPGGLIATRLQGLADATKRITDQERAYQDRLDLKQTGLEAKFARLEATLAKLQQQQSTLTARSNQNSSGG
jgi:flagellar hook-associated protein 2